MFRDRTVNRSGRGWLQSAFGLWLRLRWLALILLGLGSSGYALCLVRTPGTVNAAVFYWFMYSGGALIAAGLVEQGHNLERRGA